MDIDPSGAPQAAVGTAGRGSSSYDNENCRRLAGGPARLQRPQVKRPKRLPGLRVVQVSQPTAVKDEVARVAGRRWRSNAEGTAESWSASPNYSPGPRRPRQAKKTTTTATTVTMPAPSAVIGAENKD
jgi:hypothetical protein